VSLQKGGINLNFLCVLCASVVNNLMNKEEILSPSNLLFGTMLPTGGDGSHLFQNPPQREATLAYQIETAQVAEANGFDYMLIPYGN